MYIEVPSYQYLAIITTHPLIRAICRTKLLPVTHILVDTWMLTVKGQKK